MGSAQIPGRQVAVANHFVTVGFNIRGSSVWNWLQVTDMAPGILRWLLNFCKVCAPLWGGEREFNSLKSTYYIAYE
jgi:hypothetical protein